MAASCSARRLGSRRRRRSRGSGFRPGRARSARLALGVTLPMRTKVWPWVSGAVSCPIATTSSDAAAIGLPPTSGPAAPGTRQGPLLHRETGLVRGRRGPRLKCRQYDRTSGGVHPWADLHVRRGCGSYTAGLSRPVLVSRALSPRIQRHSLPTVRRGRRNGRATGAQRPGAIFCLIGERQVSIAYATQFGAAGERGCRNVDVVLDIRWRRTGAPSQCSVSRCHYRRSTRPADKRARPNDRTAG